MQSYARQQTRGAVMQSTSDGSREDELAATHDGQKTDAQAGVKDRRQDASPLRCDEVSAHASEDEAQDNSGSDLTAPRLLSDRPANEGSDLDSN